MMAMGLVRLAAGHAGTLLWFRKDDLRKNGRLVCGGWYAADQHLIVVAICGVDSGLRGVERDAI